MADNYIYPPFGENQSKMNASSYQGHTNGGIDFNNTENKSYPVYSMVDGTINYIGVYNTENDFKNKCAGYYIQIKTNKFNYGETLYVRYLELGWLSTITANPFDGKIKPKTKDDSGTEVSKAESLVSYKSIPVKRGDLIGYTNTFTGGQGSIHIDIQKNDIFNAGGSATYLLQFKDKTTKYGTGYSVKNGKWYQKDTIVGDPNGCVPNTTYNVIDNYFHAFILANPKKVSKVSSKGGTKLEPISSVPTEYKEKTINSNFMGSYPKTTKDLNSKKCQGLRALVWGAKNEFGLTEYGLAYGKLFRAWIIYSNLNSYTANAKSLAEFGDSWVNDCLPAWGVSNNYWTKDLDEDDKTLLFAQNLYKNIRYPNIYGIKKQSCITACNGMPTMNETVGYSEEDRKTIPSRNYPLAFSVVEPMDNLPGFYFVIYRPAKGSYNVRDDSMFE